MADLRTLVRNEMERAGAPSYSFDDLGRRRDRKRRNQRITAGVVGIAVFVAAIVAVGVAALDGGQQPASSGATGPSGEPPLAGPNYSVVRDTDRPAYVLDLDTGAMTALPEATIRSLGDRRPRSNGRFAASPDGSTLAYVALDEDDRFQIFVANLDGTEIRQVTHDPVAAISPAWSPDATRIAYQGSSGEVGVTGLFVLDVATGETMKVIDVLSRPASPGYELWLAHPTFTPDGSSLLYSDDGEVRTVPVAGGGSTLLFGAGRGGMEYADTGSMSPDGSLVTMMGNEPGGPGALRFLANADGTDLRAIGGGGSTPAGTWSPDGTRIVCTGYGRDYIFVVDVATGEYTKVAEGSAAIWLDDHTLLVEGLTTHKG